MDDIHVHPLVDADPVEEAATAPGRTLSGVQKKWLVYRTAQGCVAATRLEDPATHIAKFNSPDVPTLVLNEDLSLRLAREVLGTSEVTAAAIGQVEGEDGIALIVERFDRLGDVRLRLEDFAQILERPRGTTFEGKYQGSYEEAADVIARFSSRALIDLDRFFRLVLFNLVIGNADAHLKNFSLLERDEGLRLSPAYDLLNTLVYPRYDRVSALEIGGSKRSFDTIDRDLLTRFGVVIGLPLRAVQRTIDQLKKRITSASALALPPHIQPDDFRARYREVVIANAERMLA
ncbi:HipA domain-containing protein [Sphingomonas crocodyli]|uniref:Type II toxin-antitoxin system HipA family toxin n=1 Tax=Sphingomonas crocodyli TaxID=1979270 RepID=A0A437M7H1_9SPHN|nr:HipA domain-containing protein [Sphingomonas crocodyli]RVT93485.1 type II toxin-antitoxin system HipA family toxin [Sphingomonas crocodyli]